MESSWWTLINADIRHDNTNHKGRRKTAWLVMPRFQPFQSLLSVSLISSSILTTSWACRSIRTLIFTQQSKLVFGKSLETQMTSHSFPTPVLDWLAVCRPLIKRLLWHQDWYLEKVGSKIPVELSVSMTLTEKGELTSLLTTASLCAASSQHRSLR